jgi:hypothetical protein
MLMLIRIALCEIQDGAFLGLERMISGQSGKRRVEGFLMGKVEQDLQMVAVPASPKLLLDPKALARAPAF